MPGFASPSVNTPSKEIQAARVLCIFFVIFVHLPPYEPVLGDWDSSFGGFQNLRHFFQEILCRNSTALLSTISGFLVIGSLQRHGYSKTMLKKVLTIAVPMLLWNAIALTLRSLEAGQWPEASLVFHKLTGLNGRSELTPLNFLRDLMVCFALAPLLIAAIRRFRWWAVLTIGGVFALNFDLGLVISPAIMLFFCIGIGARMVPLPTSYSRYFVQETPILWYAAPLLLFAGVHAWMAIEDSPLLTPALHQAFLLIQRLLGAGLFWQLALRIVQWPAATKLVSYSAPSLFIIFCAHPLIIGAAWLVWQKLAGAESPLYPLFFLIVPVLIFAITPKVLRPAHRLAPQPIGLLAGGRVYR